MIVTEKQARYHLAYLQSLKPISAGHFDNEVLNDGYQRVLLSRLGPEDGMRPNEVTIEAVRRPAAEPERYSADTGPGYCVPSSCGLCSTPANVAQRITEAMVALSRIDSNIITGNIQDGQIVQECYDFRQNMILESTAFHGLGVRRQVGFPRFWIGQSDGAGISRGLRSWRNLRENLEVRFQAQWR